MTLVLLEFCQRFMSLNDVIYQKQCERERKKHTARDEKIARRKRRVERELKQMTEKVEVNERNFCKR